ncbi:LOG family protein [Polyangium aurulentum]|uniref:LOG family protein n=1 Tax=Polyangium aurulentum TaxID=2567896 RepID=UPI00146F644C|nr:LOG family protein [Polyangium aurulentum]UQA58371.1 LOG family protein [Polyangium aurulentum]
MATTTEMRGVATYDSRAQRWTASGESWHLSAIDGAKARITFAEPMALGESGDLAPTDYSLVVTPRGLPPAGVSLDVGNVAEDGFDVTWRGCSDHPGSFTLSFQVSGVKSDPVPDDRDLTRSESIGDVHAARMLFQYEAKYGTVSVMSSASIESKETVEKKIAALSEGAAALESEIGKEEDPAKKAELRESLRDSREKLSRQKRILKNSVRYWDSAKRFGELWGAYAAGEQEKALGGKYVPICTGGGPGIMYAVASGARSQNAQVLGIDTKFGNDEFHDLKDDYTLPSNIRLRMNDFAVREAALINYSNVILFWPGGYGTCWEVCETLSKIQTHRLRKRRIKAIFVHSEFWKPFFELVAHFREYGTVNAWGDRIKIPGVDDELPDVAYIAELVDTPEDAFARARSFVEELNARNELVLGVEAV